MFVSKSMSGPLAALFGAGVLFASIVSGQAAMAPTAPQATPNIHKTDCAVGMRGSLLYFAAKLVGLPARVYVGSWQDWKSDAANPVVK